MRARARAAAARACSPRLTVCLAAPSRARGVVRARSAGGTGLGVSITHSILKLHNDSKLVLSSMGEGTGSTFEMALFLKPTTQDTQHGATGSQCTSPRASRADSKAGSEHARDDGTPSLDASFSLAQPPGRLVFPDDFCCLHVEVRERATRCPPGACWLCDAARSRALRARAWRRLARCLALLGRRTTSSCR